MKRKTAVDPWKRDDVQFPRLLAEINAAGLTVRQTALLQDSMDLSGKQIDELLDRAEVAWEKIKHGRRAR